MEKGIFVKDIKPDEDVYGVFVIAESENLRTRKNEPFWKLVLVDRTGRISANLWYPASQRFREMTKGRLVAIEGHSTIFRGQLQLGIMQISFPEVALDDLDNIQDFIPAAKRPPALMYEELLTLCDMEISYPPLRNFLEAVFTDPVIRRELLIAPAAMSVHQAYAGGLLEHTLNVASLCLSFCAIYPELDRQLLIAGAVLHDLGKIREYIPGVVIEISRPGYLIGHTILGLQILEPFLESSDLDAELKEHLRHLILSHHGEYAYGASRLPQTAEAFALHYADNIDAKLSACIAAFQENSQTGESRRLSWLDRSVFLAARTPEGLLRDSHNPEFNVGRVEGGAWEDSAGTGDWR